MVNDLTHIDDVSWEDVFSVWQKHEGTDPVWQRFAAEERGWDSWEAWRRYQARQINAAGREWQVFEVQAPNKTIPQFLMGPYRGWQKQYPDSEANHHTFFDLVQDQIAWVEQNIGICRRAGSFPTRTQFIGVYAEDENKIILYEGHHRAAAVTLCKHKNNPIVFDEKPTIALTTMNTDDVAMFRDTLHISTHKKDVPKDKLYGI